MKPTRQDLANFALVAALIAVVLGVAYCQQGTLPAVPKNQAAALDAFFAANQATRYAQKVCVACDAEMRDAGSLELVPDCLARCMDATAEAVEAADAFAKSLK